MKEELSKLLPEKAVKFLLDMLFPALIVLLLGTLLIKLIVRLERKSMAKGRSSGRTRITVDATYFKVREDHRAISKALFIAYATTRKGITRS